ncbi:MAG: radical SAM protein [Clostridia bacterium]|nr:radical SAM protein [Clostridia bacterium]
MYVARILYPVEVLGPGKRVGIWFCGCPRRCGGCSNPELWEFQERFAASPQTVMRLIRTIAEKNRIDGFTLTGGDPFFQREALLPFLKQLKSISDDILVYTGYERAELQPEDLADIAVLIDGPYIAERNNGCFLRGSDNQTVHILSDKHRKKYERYLQNGVNRIQNFTTADGVVSVGIHKAGFRF